MNQFSQLSILKPHELTLNFLKNTIMNVWLSAFDVFSLKSSRKMIIISENFINFLKINSNLAKQITKENRYNILIIIFGKKIFFSHRKQLYWIFHFRWHNFCGAPLFVFYFSDLKLTKMWEVSRFIQKNLFKTIFSTFD